MREKIVNFLSSYGLIGLGLVLLFVASISVKTGHSPLITFPVAGERVEAKGESIMVGGELPESRPTMPLAKDNKEFDGDLSAISALVIDDRTDTVLFSKNSEEVRPLASITKLMSVLVLLDLPINWSTTTEIVESDLDGSSHHLENGEVFVLDDLLHIALIGSSNSAITALVRESGIAPENFVMLMNRKAVALGLLSARFVEPTGLDSGNVATAEEAAKILKEALRFNKIATYLKTGEYYVKPINKEEKRLIWTTDWLITNWVPNNFKVGDIAGKTGYIYDSKYNFAVRLIDSEGYSLRVIILGADTNEARFGESRDLAEWALDHYVWPDEDGYDALVP